MRHHLKTAFLFLLLAAAASCKPGITIEDRPYDPIFDFASNACPYHSMDRSDTPAPAGYKPFYMSHYGRHGSRFLGNASDLEPFIGILEKEKEKGNLSALGSELLDSLKAQADYSRGKYGQLTDLGAAEHRDIARRMYLRFPQIWKKNGKIRAVASPNGQRCIISMANAAMGLKSHVPSLHFDFLTGEAGYSEIINQGPTSIFKKSAKDSLKACAAKAFPSWESVSGWFVEENEELNVGDLMGYIYAPWKVNECMGRHFIDILHYISKDDLSKLSTIHSNYLYYYNGITRELGEERLNVTKPVLKTIMTQADDAISGKSGLCANLRYSHDTACIPLFCLMGLEGYNIAPSFSEVWDSWQCKDMMPMGTNLQIAFFRKKNCERILVKFLLNEKEISIPAIGNVSGPYYDWQDVKSYWKSRI